MTRRATVLACGVMDRDGIYGTRGTAVTWPELDTDPPGTGKTALALDSSPVAYLAT